RPAHGEDPSGHLELRFDEGDVSLGGLRKRTPTVARDSDPLVLREIGPPFELAVYGLALGQNPHARGELLDHAAVVAVAGAHPDSVEASEHVELRHREAREAIHTDRHP